MKFPSIEVRFAMNQRSYEFPTFVALCAAVGVESYVEVGCGRGMTTRFIRDSGVPRVVGIDMLPERPVHFDEDTPYVSGDSRNMDSVKRALELLGSFPDAVFIDTDHSYETTKREFELWWPLTTKILAFHDICLTGQGSLKFWNEINKNIRSLEIVAKDDFSNTENPLDQHPDGGWAGIGVLFK